MKKTYFLFITLVLFLQQTNAFIPINETKNESILLNGDDWKFKLNADSLFYKTEFNDTEWDNIMVPSNWEMLGYEEPLYRREISENIGYYRKPFNLPTNWENNQIYLRFDGVLLAYEAWINGQYIGKFESAFNRSEWEISKYLLADKENILAVKVYKKHTTYEFDTHDAWLLSGIFRDVTLLAVSEVYVEDFTVVTDLDDEYKNAELKIKFEIGNATSEEKEYELSGVLTDNNNTKIIDFIKTGKVKNNSTLEINTPVESPKLWSAETPNLYLLQVELKYKNKVVHQFSQQVGFREISADGNILKLNGKKLTIKGVNRHDIDPDLGRAVNKASIIKDIELMKKGNINTIRCSHYPPHPLVIKYANEYGMYLIDEIPFGHGEKYQKEPKYQHLLFARAEATIARDKNDPSVIIWSVGNENPVYETILNTAQHTKKLDPTRFILLAGSKDAKKQPEYIDIVAPHYPFFTPLYWALNPQIRSVFSRFGLDDELNSRPYISTEFNHSLTNSFEGLSRKWNAMMNYDCFAGGCIWMWSNQGIKRPTAGKTVYETEEKMVKAGDDSEILQAAKRVNEDTIIDSRGNSGTDGIVDADRATTANYWITRDVFAPVQFLDDEIPIGPGSQNIPLLIENTFDYTNLSDVNLSFEYIIDGKVTQDGTIKLSQLPHTYKKYFQRIDAPDSIHNQVMFLNYKVTDKNSRHIVDHSIKLVPRFHEPEIQRNIKTNSEGGITSKGNDLIASSYTYNGTNNKISLNNKKANELFSITPIVRVGRKLLFSEYRQYQGKVFYGWWKDYLLDNAVQQNRITEDSPNGKLIRTTYNYARKNPEKNNESIYAEVDYEFNNNGWIDVSYKLTPVAATDYFFEFGLGLLLPKELKNLKWVGDGPYSAYFDQDDASKYGIYNLESGNIDFEGNKQNTELAVITDDNGNGICVIPNNETISLEKIDNGIIFTQSILSAGTGNKTSYKVTLKTVDASKIEFIRGSFKILPLDGKNWPEYLQKLFSGE